MLINSVVGNPHIVEMIRLVVINKAFHTFQKAILSEKLGFQLHRIEKYHSPSSQILQYSRSAAWPPMLTKKIVGYVTKFEAPISLGFVVVFL